MGKEVYSYIVGSIDLINKSIIVQEQNQVTLFSYMYNRQNTMLSKIDAIDSSVKKIKSSLTDLNKKLDIIDAKVINIEKDYNKRYNKIDVKTQSELNILKNEISNIKSDLLKMNTDKISYKINNRFRILNDKFHMILNTIKHNANIIISTIKGYGQFVYDKIYKILFKKKIQQEMIEEARRKQEEEHKKKIENLNKIKEILNKPNKTSKTKQKN